MGLILKLVNLNFNILLLVTGLGPFQNKVKGKKNFWNLIKVFSKLNSKKEGVHYVFQNSDDQKKFLNSNIITTKNSTIISGNGINRKKFFSTKNLKVDEKILRFLMVGNLQSKRN